MMKLSTPFTVSILLLLFFGLTELVFLLKIKNNGEKKEWFSALILVFASIEWFYSILDFRFLNLTQFTFDSSILHTFTITGTILFVSGELIRLSAFGSLGKYYDVLLTLKTDHKLIRSGLYSKIRHPLYTGSLLLFAGFPLVLHSFGGLFLFVLIVIPAFLYRIKTEEKMLLKYFKDEYKNYIKTTGALFPKLFKR